MIYEIALLEAELCKLILGLVVLLGLCLLRFLCCGAGNRIGQSYLECFLYIGWDSLGCLGIL